jgi:ligand-binding SRPBCC domain-containing protein
MTIHTLTQAQTLPLTLEQAWDFFSSPANLNEITPPELAFRILTPNLGRMYPGQLIAYDIRLAPLIWVTWVTEITHVEPGSSFIDEQRFGPYKLWHHRHTFEAVEGGVRMTDEVHYALYGGPFGDLIHALWVGPQVKRIFDHRRRVLAERFA